MIRHYPEPRSRQQEINGQHEFRAEGKREEILARTVIGTFLQATQEIHHSRKTSK